MRGSAWVLASQTTGSAATLVPHVSLRSGEGENAKHLLPLFGCWEDKGAFRVPECFLAVPPAIVRIPPQRAPPLSPGGSREASARRQ